MKLLRILSSGTIIALAGIILFSAKAIMVKLAYQYQVSAMHLLLFRMLFSLPFYLMVILYFRPENKENIRKTDYLRLCLFGALGYYLASYLDFLGLQYLKAGLERILLFVYPTLVVLLSRVFFKTNISANQAWSMCITYLGIVLAFWEELQFEGDQVLWGAVLILLSALTYAIYLVGSDWLIPKFGVLVFTSYAMISATAGVAIHYLITDRSSLVHYPSEVYLLGFMIAIVSTLIPSFLVSLAIKKMGAPTFSILGSVGPVSTIILAYWLLDEPYSLFQLLGMAVVIIGVGRLSIKRK
ncbi:MAG: DMT family transporter [Lutibacter sp.]|jgi:drug/metabolite transporter (DMT)-like permease|nr:DMT family transporter [Lutibacter sp.]